MTILSDPGMNCTEVQKFFESLSEDLHTLNLLFTVVSYSNLNGSIDIIVRIINKRHMLAFKSVAGWMPSKDKFFIYDKLDDKDII